MKPRRLLVPALFVLAAMGSALPGRADAPAPAIIPADLIVATEAAATLRPADPTLPPS